MMRLIWLSVLCMGIVFADEEVYGETHPYEERSLDAPYDTRAEDRYEPSEDNYGYEPPRPQTRNRVPSSETLTAPGYRGNYEKRQGNTFDPRNFWKSRPAQPTNIAAETEANDQGRSRPGTYNRRSNSKSDARTRPIISSRRPVETAPQSSFMNYDENGHAQSPERNRTSSAPRPQTYNPRDSYEPSYNYDGYGQATHHHGGNSYGQGYQPSARKPKSYFGLFVAPLASIAFLATAAALAASPSYVTLSSLNLGRKKRALETELDPTVANSLTPELKRKLEELQTLEKFMSTVPADTAYQQQVMSMYLSCSGYMEKDNQCLDRVFCEYGNAKSSIAEEERDVLSIILYNIMTNKHVKEDYKNRLRVAARVGRDSQQCTIFQCVELTENDEKDE